MKRRDASSVCWSVLVSALSGAAGHCIDIHSHVVSQGLHYVPGPNSCTVCICDKGSPRWCKSVLCSPPQNCQSFQVGNSCCEFKCLDDILGGGAAGAGGGSGAIVVGNGGAAGGTTTVGGGVSSAAADTYDAALRLVASLVTAVLSLSLLFFLVHRLRQRKGRHRTGGVPSHVNHQLSDEHRHHHHHHAYNAGIGYITGNLGYLSSSVGYLGAPPLPDCEYPYNGEGYALWKPAGGGGGGNYFPRGEAPPPYEEAVRASRAEAHYHQQQQHQQQQCEATAAAGNPVSLTLVHNTHVNITQQQQQHHQQQQQRSDDQQQQQPQLRLVCRQSKSLLVNQVDVRSETGVPIVVLPPASTQTAPTTCTTITNRKRPTVATATVSRRPAAGLLIAGPQPPLDTNSATRRREPRPHRTIPTTVHVEQTATALTAIPYTAARQRSTTTVAHRQSSQARPQPTVATQQPVPQQATPVVASVVAAAISAAASAAVNAAAPLRDRRTTYDLDSDLDDYRSECENCKSLSLENCSDELLTETMTLQRHPAEPTNDQQPPFYRTSLTLPAHSRKLRTLNAAHRDTWFTPMQEMLSSSDDE